MKSQDFIVTENYKLEDDQNVAHKNDHRRTRLTLKHLNRLRQIRELKKYEQAQHRELVKILYAPPSEPMQ